MGLIARDQSYMAEYSHMHDEHTNTSVEKFIRNVHETYLNFHRKFQINSLVFQTVLTVVTAAFLSGL